MSTTISIPSDLSADTVRKIHALIDAERKLTRKDLKPGDRFSHFEGSNYPYTCVDIGGLRIKSAYEDNDIKYLCVDKNFHLLSTTEDGVVFLEK